MGQVTIGGIDLAKQVVSVHGCDEHLASCTMRPQEVPCP